MLHLVKERSDFLRSFFILLICNLIELHEKFTYEFFLYNTLY